MNSVDEALVVTLTHEAIHANHFAIFNDARIQAENKKFDTAYILQQKGYSQEFIDIFIDKDTNEWTTNEQRDISMHEYMNKYGMGLLMGNVFWDRLVFLMITAIKLNIACIVDSALEEYRNDYK